MNYIVLDLEWNQSPRGKAGKHAQMPFEIIEIGAVKLDQDRKIVGNSMKWFIRPCISSFILKRKKSFILKWRSWRKQEDLKKNRYTYSFFRWCGGDYVMCTWGSMDLTELQRNLAFFRLPNPLPKPLLYYDVQKLFSLLYEDGKSRTVSEGRGGISEYRGDDSVSQGV